MSRYNEAGNQIGWIIYVINGDIFARPISFILETTCDKEILVTEDKEGKFTGYYDRKFYINIPYETAVTTVTVDKINAETLDGITFDTLSALTGAARMASAEVSSGGEESAVASSDNIDVYSSTVAITGAANDNTAIIVSLGDSFSAGEGIEDFIDQNKPWPDKVQSKNFLAHRSENAWPRQLKVPADKDAGTYKNVELHFVAASGAETKHIISVEQPQPYLKDIGTLDNPWFI